MGRDEYRRRSRSPRGDDDDGYRRRRDDDDYSRRSRPRSKDRHQRTDRDSKDRDRDWDRDDRRRRHESSSARNTQEGAAQWGQKRQRSRSRSPGRPSLSLPSQSDLAPRDQDGNGDRTVASKAALEPNFKPSGLLAAETNTVNGVVLKYNEPPEARKPVRPWRLYVFKGKEQVDMFHVNRQSCYLLGRDRLVVDIPLDHPSTSKQHAVLQFRQIAERNEFGDQKTLIKPFIIDLESANGTTVNDETVPQSRFYELKSGDVLKFAYSTREYVLLSE